MMNVIDTEFLEAVKRLHREKDAMYRNAWKKRGEVLSILPNIARKVDRLEYVLEGAPSARDESLFDTVVDLFVYCLKYEAFLADLDLLVAETLFSRDVVRKPYSEGLDGFDYLLSLLNSTAHKSNRLTLAEAVSHVLACFSKLEECFSGISTTHSVVDRLVHVQALVDATLNMIEAIKDEKQALYVNFIRSRSGGSS